MALCAMAALAGGDAAHAAKANIGNTAYGEVGVDQFGYAVGQWKQVIVNISGEAYGMKRTEVNITITYPDERSETHTVRSARDGGFVHYHALDYHASPAGTYYVSASADGKVLGQVGFEMRYMGGPPGGPYGNSPVQQGDAGSGTAGMQPPPSGRVLTVYTDRPHYIAGDTIRIYGTAGMSQEVMIRVSLGSIYESVSVHPDGTYVLEIETAGKGGFINGVHEVWVGSSGPARPVTAAFTFGATPAAGADSGGPDPGSGLSAGGIPGIGDILDIGSGLSAGGIPGIGDILDIGSGLSAGGIQTIVIAVVILAVIVAIAAALRRRRPAEDGASPGNENKAYDHGAGGAGQPGRRGTPAVTYRAQMHIPASPAHPSGQAGSYVGAYGVYRITGREIIVPDSNMIIDILQYPTGSETPEQEREIKHVIDHLDMVRVPSWVKREISSAKWGHLKPKYNNMFGKKEVNTRGGKYKEDMQRLQQYVGGLADFGEVMERWIKAKRRELQKLASQEPEKYGDLNGVLYDKDMNDLKVVNDVVIPAICNNGVRVRQAADILTRRIGNGDIGIVAQALEISRSTDMDVLLLSNDSEIYTVLSGGLAPDDRVHIIPHWKFDESMGHAG